MKNLLIFLFVVPLFSLAQIEIDTFAGIANYRMVHDIDIPKSDLKVRTEEWLAKAYGNSNYTIKLSNEDKIVSKGVIPVTTMLSNFYGFQMPNKENVDFILDIAFKEGRYKVEFQNIDFRSLGIEYFDIEDPNAFEKYRRLVRESLEDFDGPGKKATLNMINNDKRASKFYEKWKASYVKNEKNYDSMLNEISSTLRELDVSLYKYLDSSEDEEEW